jgi:hypothetical protein
MTDDEKVKWFNEALDWLDQFDEPLDIDMYNFTEVAEGFYIDFLRVWAEENNKKLPDWM